MVMRNAASTPLNLTRSGLPDVSGALAGWFQPMTFTRVVKTVKNATVVEVKTDYVMRGVRQPLPERKLQMKPEGQRSWRWEQVHAYPDVELIPDEIITFNGIQYRVMGVWQWKEYGFQELHITQDYTD